MCEPSHWARRADIKGGVGWSSEVSVLPDSVILRRWAVLYASAPNRKDQSCFGATLQVLG